MKSKLKVRPFLGLIGCLLICIIGIWRIFTQSNTGAPLFISYLFAICGFIGTVANGVALAKTR
ncbi:hypothetical protein [Neobacillus dielmonensis]|uniref:hypothetical protein n=1 Tax=Neobacillus dielmonensis TaxID=1347369 RepID=UPI0005AB39A0|nr:hypothetical protein [Neobacillus dielmonensis]